MQTRSYLNNTFTVQDSEARVRQPANLLKYVLYTPGDILPPGKNLGEPKIIRQGTRVGITIAKSIDTKLTFVLAQSANNDDLPFGWTSADNLAGGFLNEGGIKGGENLFFPFDIDKYNVQAAIADMLDYHNQCTLNAGLEEATDSIKSVNDPGLNAALVTARKIQQLQGSNQTIGSGAAIGAPLPDNELPSSVRVEAKQVVQEGANRILTRITTLQNMTDLKDKLVPIKTNVETEKSTAINNIDGESEKVTTMVADLAKKSAALSVASDEQTHAVLSGDILALRITARALSQRLRSIAQNFKTFVQQQEGILDGFVAATKVTQPNPSK